MPFIAMVAGPNGSGKTTLIQYLRSQGVDLGEYVNADDIAAGLSGAYDVRVREAQAIADERRAAFLANGTSFTFETVMSHPSKVELFAQASAKGFETLLFFVSTGDPALNVARVAQRVALGGHDVPQDRIVSRYARTMALFPLALVIADRAFVYENNGPDGMFLGLTKASETNADGLRREHYELAEDAPGWIRVAYESLPEGGAIIS